MAADRVPAGAPGGFVLPVVTVVLAVLALSTPALVYAAAQAVQIARARVDAIQAGLAARSATQAALGTWRTTEAARIPTGGRRTVVDGLLGGEVRMSAVTERLGPSLYLIRGEGVVGRPERPRARARAGYLVTAPDVLGALDTLTGGLTPAADPLTLPGWPPPQALERLAERTPRGAVAPEPSHREGACDTADPSNWGAPRDPGDACASLFPLIYVGGSLTLEGGAGQGVLLVEGDLTLASDAEFHGLILLGGTLSMAPGTRIVGAVRGAPGVVIPSGAITFEAAAVRAAVAASQALNRPFRAGRRAWIPLF